MKIIVFALFIEAKVFIHRLNLKQANDSYFKIFSNDDYIVIISGVGKINSCLATSYLINKISDEIISITNYGICGSFTQRVGSSFLINKITDFDNGYDVYLDVLLSHNLFENSLISVSSPVLNKDDRLLNGSLFDMEGFGFFQGALKFLPRHKISIIKTISDNANSISSDMVIDIISKEFDKIMIFIDSYEINQEEILSSKDKSDIKKYCEDNRLSESSKEIYKKAFIYKKLRK